MKPIRSIPIDITDPEMAEVFAGLALYNTGAITIAYRIPIVCEQIDFGDRVLNAIPYTIDPGTRITLRMRERSFISRKP